MREIPHCVTTRFATPTVDEDLMIALARWSHWVGRPRRGTITFDASHPFATRRRANPPRRRIELTGASSLGPAT